jgi:4a-hydroxytetrahydrobiopterin dehydratase
LNEQPEDLDSTTPPQPLSSRDIDLALRDLRGWNRQEGGLHRRFRCASFSESIALVNRIAGLATEANHFPNLDIRYRNVIVFLTTHEAGGVTRLDLDLAASINQIED